MKIKNKRSLLSRVILAGALSSSALTGAMAGDSYLAVWAADKATDDKKLDTDFLAIIDSDPRSPTYGKVVNSATLQDVPHANLLDELGVKKDLSSARLNEAHHMTHDPVVVKGSKYLYMGGLISTNIFRCDVTNPMKIPTCPLVTPPQKVKNFSAVDDFVQLPNGNLLATYMGSKNLTTPGGVVEIDINGNVVGEYGAAKPGGPTRYMPNVNKVTDTGLLAHPHGIMARADLNLLVTSDYADPMSLASVSRYDARTQDLGTTVRFWDLRNMKAGPRAISQVPVGAGREGNPVQNASEGVMSVALMNLPRHKGAFAASMMGGAIYYTPDATAANPQFREVFRVGPGAGASLFVITPDDRYLILPVSGIVSPGDPEFNRDYPGEHARRVIVLNIEKLVKSGLDSIRTGSTIKCDAPPKTLDAAGTIVKIHGHNNNAHDCPVETSSLNMDSKKNFDSHGGPHFIGVDHNSHRIAVADYFVELTPFGLPGTGSAGDDRICMARVTDDGRIELDAKFKDELTGKPCVDMDRPANYVWPGRGKSGGAKPHMVSFINMDNRRNWDDDDHHDDHHE